MSVKTTVNIRKIAELANVSVATVSRVLHPDEQKRVSPELRTRIMRLCEQYHYYPNMHTVRMFSRRANTVALLAPAECMYKFIYSGGLDHNLAGVICGAEMGLAEQSLYLSLVAITEKFVEDKEYLKLCRGKLVDGIMIWGWYPEQKFLEELLAENLPTVMIASAAPVHSPPRLEYQDFEGMQEIARYVLSRGHRRIAIATPLLTSYAGQERLRGIDSMLAEAGIKPVYRSRVSEFDYEKGMAAGNEILDHCGDRITCIICGNDYAAFGVARALRERGLRVPDDISVTGADGIFVHGQIQQLTSFRSPSFEIGQRGAQMLAAMLRGEAASASPLRLPVQLISGDTVKKL